MIDKNKYLNEYSRALCCIAPIFPTGYVLVPVEPSFRMLNAGAKALSEGKLSREIYQAMLYAELNLDD